jgi:hypothetical protein
MKIRLALGSAVLVLLAGCGGDDPDASVPGDEPPASGSPTGDPQAAAPAEDQPWLVRFEIGTDELASGVSYVRVTPTSGQTQVTNLELPPADFDPTEYLQVDAGRNWAVRANFATLAEEDNGTLRVYSLTEQSPAGKPKRVDVDLREVTGVPALKPLGFAFDPEEPGLLRVLATDGRLFEYDVASGTATTAGTVETKRGFELVPRFDVATGLPLLRNRSTYEYEEGGAYTAGGITPVRTEQGACPDAAALHSTIEDAAGGSWDACLDGRRVKIFHKAAGDAEWQLVGESAPRVPTDTMSMTWVLPPVA